MPDLEALEAAVCAAPTDDPPREAYADAVEATDRARAQYIRWELQLARWRRSGPMSDERTSMSTRAFTLQDRHRARWEASVRQLVDGCGFYRGFVEYVRVDAARFLDIAPELYRRAPILHLDLTDARPVLGALFASPHLARIVSLGLLRSHLDDADCAVIAASDQLGRLTWLDLALNDVGLPGVELLAASDRLPRLGYVSLLGNPLDDPTPRHADGYDATSRLALEWMARYGHRDWLDARPRGTWPPDRDAVLPLDDGP